MNHLAELRLIMCVGIILSLYGNLGQTEATETIRANRGRAWTKSMLNIGKVPFNWTVRHLRYVNDDRAWKYDMLEWYGTIYKRSSYLKRIFWYCIIQVYSHTYGFHYQKPHFWVHGWFVDWLIDNFYEVIYMVPAPRRLKVGPKTLVNWMAIFRYHRGLFVNNIKTGFYISTWKHWAEYKLNMDWPSIRRSGYYVTGALVVILLSTLVSPLFGFLFIGATYYFSGTGNDGNTGLSDEQAWRSLDKLNNVNLGNDNTYYFKRGASYTLSSGTQWICRGSGHTITAYGTTGDIPIWQSGSLNAMTGGHTIEYINMDEKAGDGGGAGFVFGDVSGACTNVTVQHCTLTVIIQWGIHFAGRYDCSYATVYNNTIVEGSINIHGGLNYHHAHTLTYNCDLQYNVWDRIQIHEGTNYTYYLENDHTVHDCFAASSNSNAIDLTSGYEIYVYDCEFGLAGDVYAQVFMGDVCYDMELYRNYVHSQNGSGILVLLSDSHTTMWGNLLDMTTVGDFPPIAAINFDGANDHNEYKHDINFYKNTILSYRQAIPPIYVSSGGPDSGARDWSASETRIRLKWNIIATAYGGTAPTTWIYYQHPTRFAADEPLQDIDTNLWGAGTFQALSGATPYTWVQWQALGWDANGVSNTNPEFLDPSNGDYHIQSSSPARGMGPGTGTYQPDFDGITTDYDAGAYEYDIGPTPPTNLTITNVAVRNLTFRS